MKQSSPLLALSGVGKQFDGNHVLKNINFTLNKGEILGLVGENGAGKSTLMKILFSMPVIMQTGGYEGTITFDGKELKLKNPVDALKAGIGMVHQEFSLIPGFTTTENILLNTEITQPSVLSKMFSKKLETLNLSEMKKNAMHAIKKLGVDIDPDMLISEMPVGHKQFIEIAREINRDNVKLLVFDEPTAVLTETEAEIFLKAVKHLAETGISIIFISHRLSEITSVCDKIVVLRDGGLVTEQSAKGVTTHQIAEWMVGRDMQNDVAPDVEVVDMSDGGDKDIIMEINHLWVDMPGEFVQNVNLRVRRGEILGIGGLAGQGKLGIPNGIMGLYPSGGEVLFNGKPLDLTSPIKILKSGLAFVSEDRRGVGLLLDEAIDWNITFDSMQVHEQFLKKYLGGMVKFRDEKAMSNCAQEFIKSLEIRCTSEKQPAKQLSGGNQQKVCLAKAFTLGPELLFVSEPTRGIDIGAKMLVLDALRRYNKENNTTIIIVSSELEELRSICQRIAIVCDGQIAGILPSAAKAVDFGLLMSGENIHKQVPPQKTNQEEAQS